MCHAGLRLPCVDTGWSQYDRPLSLPPFYLPFHAAAAALPPALHHHLLAQYAHLPPPWLMPGLVPSLQAAAPLFARPQLADGAVDGRRRASCDSTPAACLGGGGGGGEVETRSSPWLVSSTSDDLDVNGRRPCAPTDDVADTAPAGARVASLSSSSSLHCLPVSVSC